MLSFHQVCASYGKNQVLDHIDFSLVPHKLTAVVGRNGSGKSTLVSCVNQELPYTGEITFSDRNLAVMTLRERAQLISILPQTLHSPAVTVEELTAFGRNPYLDFGKRMSPKDWQAVDDALEAIGISGLRDKLVTELSGGERQKAYLAMVLAQNTRVMILDEPTTYMDMEYEAAFFPPAGDAENKTQDHVSGHHAQSVPGRAVRRPHRRAGWAAHTLPGRHTGLRGQRSAGVGVSCQTASGGG